MQEQFDELFNLLENNKITRQEYVDRLNKLAPDVPSQYKRSVDRRRDSRTLGEFALQVYDNTKREKFLIEQWCGQWPDKEYGIIDHGIANNGCLILDTSKCKSVSDYKLYVWKGGNHGYESSLLEIKFCPCQWKLTYKQADFAAYLREESLILTIMGDTRMLGPNGDPDNNQPLQLPAGLQWILMGASEINHIMEKIPVRMHREVGYKPSYQLFKASFPQFVKVENWRVI